MIASMPDVVAEKAEDDALGWLLRGFKNPSNSWVLPCPGVVDISLMIHRRS
jgi:hypothetical protein